MSLINKMLRDLDERQASAAERAGLASQVRALPRVRRFPWWLVLLMLAGVIVGAAGLWFVNDMQRPQPAAAPVLVVTSVPVAPVTVAMPALVVPMPAEEQEAMSPEADAAGIGALQLDVKLSQPAPIRSAPATPTVVASPKTVVDATPATIDKRPRAPPTDDAAEAEYRKAMAAFRQGRSSEALAGLQDALRMNGRHASARQALLSLLMDQRRWPEAQNLAADGLALDAAQPGWAMILARLQVEHGQLADAQETMARHAIYGERSADYQAFHALLLQRLQRPREAVERYRTAAELRPGEGRWWFGLGLALEADQRPQEARAAFQRAGETGNLPPELVAAVVQRLR